MSALEDIFQRNQVHSNQYVHIYIASTYVSKKHNDIYNPKALPLYILPNDHNP